MSFSPCHVMMVVDGDKGKDKDREGQYPIMGICVAPCGPTKKKQAERLELSDNFRIFATDISTPWLAPRHKQCAACVKCKTFLMTA